MTIEIQCKGFSEACKLCDAIIANGKAVTATMSSPRHNEYWVIVRPTITGGE